ncbi:MAG: hypothetical protein KDM91_10010 [Verrucomicrobiae bacterium]|nr:hypothetical protein [Verrucomicrobiae bacterium]MCP5540886.1 hypothetical protein [Akkermansiaceae bacterium]
MSDSNSPPPPPPPPPPLKLPDPDGFGNPNQQQEVNRERAKEAKKNRKKKDRRHPSDPYEPLKKKRGGCGCGCLSAALLTVLLVGGGIVGGLVHLSKEVEREFKDFEMVRLDPNTKNVTEAPEKPTVLMGGQVLYEAPETHTEIAFIGGAWWLSGTFHEKVYFRGGQLTLEPGSKFLKGLDVKAALFDAGSAEIEGGMTGSVMHQK